MRALPLSLPLSRSCSTCTFIPALSGFRLLTLLLVAFILSLASPPRLALAETLFAHSTSQYEGGRYLKQVKRQSPSEVQPLEVWIKRAILAREANPHSARQHYEAALHGYPQKASLWLELAKTIRAIVSASNNKRGLHRFYSDGTGAAFNAFQFGKDDKVRAEGLAQLGYFLKLRSYWRPSLNAYRASLDLVANKEINQIYQELRAEKGFRITNYKINSDLSQPRLCIQFSEKLYARGTDYSTFFKINNDDPDGVRVEARQICLDGFKHGETYKIAVRQGLPSVVGEQLLKSSDITVYVRDRSPSVRFSSKAYILPKFGQRGLPLVSVNAKQAEIEVFRIGDRNLIATVLEGQFGASLSDYQAEQIADHSGASIYKGKVDIESKLNKDVTTALPVQTILPDMQPGLYIVRAWPGNSKYGSDRGSTQWFIISDIGLSSIKAQNGLYGYVRSLSNAAPTKGVLVRLMAKNNEILGTQISDAAGTVKFDASLLAGKGGNSPALLVAEASNGEYGFVDLTKASFDLTDRGVAGREAPGPLDGFVYTERGVYRPGEEVQFTALLRDQQGKGTARLPLTMIITRPDGKEHARVSLPDQGAGGRSYSMALIQSAMTGTWRVQLVADEKRAPIGGTSFLVEDYVPERMELKLRSENELWASNRPAEIRVSGAYLYGAPAAKHELKGDYTILRKAGGLQGYKGFAFGLHDERFLNIHKTIDRLGLLNEKGKTTLNLDLPDFERPSKPIEARINLRLLEPGGRQVVRAVTLPIANERPMIGIKKLSSAEEMKTDKKARFEVVRLDKKARKTAEALKWELVEITKHYQWYNQNGYWRYEPVTYTNRVAQGTIETDEDKPVVIEAPVSRGQYRLEVVSHTFSQLAASTQFFVDWYGARDADKPDVLEIATDKATHQVGDQLKVQVKPQAAGRTLVAVMGESIIETREVEMSATGGEVTFDITEEWGVGAYVVAMHYHRLDEATAKMPGRAIGVKWVKLDEAPRSLEVAVELPDHHAANKSLKLPVAVKGLASGEQAYVALALVDEGILSLTDYQSPKPEAHYYGQRRLSSEIRDVYGKLIDGMGGVIGRIRSGGDAAGLKLQGAPNSVKPVALYSGIVALDSEGKAEIEFEVPQFNGTLRVMSVAWSAEKLGSSEARLIVRDPVVVLASTPLFLTKGDSSRLFLSIDNVDAAEGDYQLAVTSSNGLEFVASEMEAPLSLKRGERVNVALSMTASQLGLATYSISLKPTDAPDGDAFKIVQSHELYIKPAQPNATWRTVKKLSPNGGKLALGKDIFADIIPETARATVSVGHLAGLDVAGLFEQLDRYPYGCAEQTTSRAMPLLYAAKIAPLYGQSIARDLPKKIEGAVKQLAALQNSQGGFGLWSPGYTDMWLTAYVTDFLSRAREMKFAINPEMQALALQRLKNTVNFASDFKKGGEDIAYALYVLARNGEANVGDLRYYADTKISHFSTPLAQAQIAASLAMYGDVKRAAAAFKVAYQSIENGGGDAKGTGAYRRDYGTRLRDRAALLALAAESKDFSLPKAKLINALVEERASKTFTSTQENAWLLLAANALEDHDRAILLEVNGDEKEGLFRQSFAPSDVAASNLVIANKSAEEVMAVLTIHGSANNPLPALEQGIGLKRQFYSLKGEEISLINAKQNDRVIVVLSIEDRDNKGGRLLLTDHIPAGFIIENPNLVTGSNLANFSWLKTSIWPVHQSFRDDRFTAAFNLTSGRRNSETRVIRVAYIMRAAHDGRYIHPAAHIEDMYRPNRFARTGAQHVIVEKP